MAASQTSNVAHVRPVGADFNGEAKAEPADSAGAQPETVEMKAGADAPASTAKPAASETPATPEQPRKRKIVMPIIALAVLAAGGWYGYQWWTTGRFMVSTDDAYIEGDIASISPKVSGYIEKLNVVANQRVKAGEPLITLDSKDYQIAAEQTQAQIDTELLSLKRFDAQVVGAKASLQQAQAQKVAYEATLRGADTNLKRASELQQKDVGTVASLDSAQVAVDQARANLAGADANIAAADAAIAVLVAQRAEAESTVRSLRLAHDKAERDLSFTVLKAPYDGVFGNLSVQTGDLVSAGQRLAALVPTNQLYIDANFKETQLTHMVPGSKVNIHVDAFDDEPLVGTVTSLSPASGSVFSLLPAENATGNFTKVIQRVPVRIALPQEALDSGRLRAGLSVVVDVDTRTAPK